MIQLNPTIPLDTPKGPGFAHFLLDYGQEHNSLWGVFLNASGEFWWMPNKEILLQKNFSMGVRNVQTS